MNYQVSILLAAYAAAIQIRQDDKSTIAQPVAETDLTANVAVEAQSDKVTPVNSTIEVDSTLEVDPLEAKTSDVSEDQEASEDEEASDDEEHLPLEDFHMLDFDM
jgi:hypothetical protein